MVKGNRRELERLLGRHFDDEASTLRGACEVHAMGVPTVAVTRGREGAVAVKGNSRHVQAWRGQAPRVRAVSAVGSGDAFLAAAVLTLDKGGSLEDALRMGVASGSATVLNPGTELCRNEDVERLLQRVKVQRLESVPVLSPA
jgi:6-phosphofructokinase 2